MVLPTALCDSYRDHRRIFRFLADYLIKMNGAAAAVFFFETKVSSSRVYSLSDLEILKIILQAVLALKIGCT